MTAKIPTKKKTPTLPKTPGGCADALTRLDHELTTARAVVKMLEADRVKLKEHALKIYRTNDTLVAKGKLAQVEFKPKTVYSVKDWKKVYTWMFKHKDPAILQKRLSDGLIKEMHEAKKKVPPGIEINSVLSLSITQKNKDLLK